MTNAERSLRPNILRVSSWALTVAALGAACSSSHSGTSQGGAGSGGTVAGAGGTAAGSGNGGTNSAGADNAGANDGDSTSPVLTGDPAAPAMGAITDRAPAPAAPADVADNLILTKLDVWIAPNATVGQFNAALAAIGGQIAYMRAGSNALTVSFPRVADEASLEAKRRVLASAPGILFAALADLPDPESLPPSPADAVANIGYLFASKFPAAWNLSALATKGCETRKVPLWITDFFTAAPVANFTREVPGFTVTPTTPNNVPHGYRVTAIAAAQFDANPTTGANPFLQCLDVRGVRVDNFSPLERNGVIATALAGTKGIVNGSFGHPIPACKDTGCTTATFEGRGQLIDSWVLKVADWRRETLKFDDDVLFVAAGGNTRDKDAGLRYPVFGDARIAGEMAMASSSLVFGTPRLSIFQDAAYFQPYPAYSNFPSLVSPPSVVQVLQVSVSLVLAASVKPAENVVIVGSTDASNQESTFSNTDPDVHAVGEGIVEVDGDTGSGTSYSAPQVAGLASYLWLLSDDLRALPASITRRAIVENAVVPTDAPTVRALDAFASALSLDKTNAPPSPGSTPVRLALLDVDNNGVFDDSDVAAFAAAYVGQTQDPTQNWGRLDLNGDGYVGGGKTSRFDLDPQGSTQFGAAQYSTVQQTYDNQSLTFDENGVTDRQILCYYAYSPLYTGSVSARDDKIAEACGLTPPADGGVPGGGGGPADGGVPGDSGAPSCQAEGTFFCDTGTCCPGLICVGIDGLDYPQCYKPKNGG